MSWSQTLHSALTKSPGPCDVSTIACFRLRDHAAPVGSPLLDCRHWSAWHASQAFLSRSHRGSHSATVVQASRAAVPVPGVDVEEGAVTAVAQSLNQAGVYRTEAGLALGQQEAPVRVDLSRPIVGRNRRILPVATRSSEGRYTEPTADAEVWPPEPVFMPQSRPSKQHLGSADSGGNWPAASHQGRQRSAVSRPPRHVGLAAAHDPDHPHAPA
jgi:hypothetical protein